MEERQPEHSSSPAPGSPVSGVVVGCSVVHKRFALPKLIDPAKMTVGHDGPRSPRESARPFCGTAGLTGYVSTIPLTARMMGMLQLLNCRIGLFLKILKLGQAKRIFNERRGGLSQLS